jgi:hypothetical protein
MSLDTRHKSVPAIENNEPTVSPTRCAVRTTFAALVITVLAIFLLFEWPGFLVGNHCAPIGVRTELINGHDYCTETVQLNYPNPQCPTPGNGTTTPVGLYRFTFELSPWVCSHDAGTVVTVIEPNGTTFHGGTTSGGPFGPTTTWFAHDNESGIYQPSFTRFDITLYVETGT